MLQSNIRANNFKVLVFNNFLFLFFKYSQLFLCVCVAWRGSRPTCIRCAQKWQFLQIVGCHWCTPLILRDALLLFRFRLVQKPLQLVILLSCYPQKKTELSLTSPLQNTNSILFVFPKINALSLYYYSRFFLLFSNFNFLIFSGYYF